MLVLKKKGFTLMMILSLISINHSFAQNHFPVNGNVGIGTQDPKGVLNIVGTPQDAGGYTLVLGLVSGSNLRLGYNTNYTWIQSHGAVPLRINEAGNDVLINPNGGNVGIGTLLAREKLSVNGNIRAREIKVEIENWPDFVFTDTHQLPSLKNIEQFIKQNGHLPGLPSASQVKDEGVNLGEMNAKLLEKIEELTLHLIQQEKEIELLKANQKITKTIVNK